MKQHQAWLAMLAWILSVSVAQARDGQALYNSNCAACHQKTGAGVAGAAPALRGSRLTLGDPKPLVGLLLFGRGGMPGFNDRLSDAAMVEIVNYTRTAWGNSARPITAVQVATARTRPRLPPGR